MIRIDKLMVFTWWDDICRDIINSKIYLPRWQNSLVPAQYWHNPLDQATYASKSQFLADINLEPPNSNPTYSANLQRLEKLVLVKYEYVSIVTGNFRSICKLFALFGFALSNQINSICNTSLLRERLLLFLSICLPN